MNDLMIEIVIKLGVMSKDSPWENKQDKVLSSRLHVDFSVISASWREIEII